MGIWMAIHRIWIRKKGIVVTAEAYSQRIGEALRARYGDRRHAAKKIGRMADATDRAAQKWMTGLCGPQVKALLLLMAREPAVAAAVQDLVDAQRQLDEERERARPARHGAR